MFRPFNSSDPAPSHPGEVLRVDILPCLGMTPSALAAHLGISPAVLEDLLLERTAVTLDLAQRLGLVLGQGPHYWLALQMQYDLWQAEQSVPDGIRPLDWDRSRRRRGDRFTGGEAAA